MPSPRRRPHAVVALLAALLLTGCEAALDVRVELDRNGAGTLAVTVSADAEMLARAEEAGADPFGELAAAGRGLPGWEVQDETLPTVEGGGRRVELRTEVAGPADLEARSGQLARALSAPEVALLEGFTVELEDRTVRLQGRAGLMPTPVVAELGLQPQEVVDLLEGSGAFRYTVRALLPGPVLRANATSVPPQGQPGELVWEIPPGQSVALDAVAERPQTLGLLLVGGAVSGVLLLGGGLLLVLRRR